MKESVHLFGRSKSLVGVISSPDQHAVIPSRPAVIFLNSGLVHRAGPNRLYVQAARALAEQGLLTFRFDFNGVGDSAIRNDKSTFAESAIVETLEAMDFLQETMCVRHFVLTGICSGAVVALKTAIRDQRISALIPINIRDYRGEVLTPSEHDAVSLHYYWRMKFNPVSWKRLFTGATDYSRLTRVLTHWGKILVFWRRKEQTRSGELLSDLETVFRRDIPVQLIYAQGDLGLDYFQVHLKGELGRQQAAGKLRLDIVPGADHLFTLRRNQEALLAAITGFTGDLATPNPTDRRTSPRNS